MTGAAGGVGRYLRREFTGRYRLLLTDIKPVADLSPEEQFVAADLADAETLTELTRGVDGIVHLGGYSVEGPWEKIRAANIEGTYNLYEAARGNGVPRIVFASSNHAIGFYERGKTIDHSVMPKPDSRYGVSKVFGEALASLYADKYGIGSLCVRIGNVSDAPNDTRKLAVWISPRDLAQLVGIGLEHADLHCEIVYGVSANRRGWWDNSNAHRLGFKPQDGSERFAEQVLADSPGEDPESAAARYQGGNFVCAESGGDPAKPESL